MPQSQEIETFLVAYLVAQVAYICTSCNQFGNAANNVNFSASTCEALPIFICILSRTCLQFHSSNSREIKPKSVYEIFTNVASALFFPFKLNPRSSALQSLALFQKRKINNLLTLAKLFLLIYEAVLF